MEISLCENSYPRKKHEENIKTWMVNSTGNAEKNLRKQAKMLKQRKTPEHVGTKRKR